LPQPFHRRQRPSRGSAHILILPPTRRGSEWRMSDLRPMEFGEVLDGAFTMYRRNFGLFFRLSVAISAVPAALFLYLQFRFSGTTPDQSMAVFQTHLGELIGWDCCGPCSRCAPR